MVKPEIFRSFCCMITFYNQIIIIAKIQNEKHCLFSFGYDSINIITGNHRQMQIE